MHGKCGADANAGVRDFGMNVELSSWLDLGLCYSETTQAMKTNRPFDVVLLDSSLAAGILST